MPQGAAESEGAHAVGDGEASRNRNFESIPLQRRVMQTTRRRSSCPPPDIVDETVERTDGVPLFVEELTKAVVEAGADRGHVSIPARFIGGILISASLSQD